MTTEKTIVLITGGNGGIGFETALQLLSESSKHVIIGSRVLENGEAAVQDLQSRGLPGTVEVVQLDVTSDDSIAAAAKKVETDHGRLDILVNNAAIAARSPANLSTREIWKALYDTNCVGAHLMVEAFAPLLKKSIGTARIVNVSSSVGSITIKLDPTDQYYNLQGTPYRATKSALNMINACQAYEYGQLGMKVFTVNPGFTVSRLGPHNNPDHGAQPTSEGARPIVEAIRGERDDYHGQFLTAGGTLPW